VFPPPSQIYTAADFNVFFAHIAKKLKKPEEKLFAKHKSLLKMLGAIPIEFEKKIELKSQKMSDEITIEGEDG